MGTVYLAKNRWTLLARCRPHHHNQHQQPGEGSTIDDHQAEAYLAQLQQAGPHR